MERAQARQVAGDIPRETFERAVEAAAKAVCGHRSYRMVAAEVLAAVDHAGAVDALRRIAQSESSEGVAAANALADLGIGDPLLDGATSPRNQLSEEENA